MRTITTKQMYEAIVRAGGLDPSTAGITASQKAEIAELLNDRVKEGWEFAFWPDTLQVEQRRYRETWDATLNYATDDEVFYTDRYFISLVNDNVGNTPPASGDTAYWSEIVTGLVRYIDFQQEGETEIGKIDAKNAVFGEDPRIYRFTDKVTNCWINDGKLMVGEEDAPAEPWIRFQPPPPRFSLTEWDDETAYAIGDLVYLAAQGESYKALQSSTNKDPYSQTEYWEPVEFPEFLMTYVKHAVNADRLLDDVAANKALGRAEAELERLYDSQIESVGESRRAVFR